MIDMANVIEQRISNHEKSICEKCSHRIVCRAIDDQPCFECNQFAEEVVRCTDCKHWLPEEAERCKVLKQEPYGLCNRYPQRTSWQDTTDQDDFCSYGERRTNE